MLRSAVVVGVAVKYDKCSSVSVPLKVSRRFAQLFLRKVVRLSLVDDCGQKSHRLFEMTLKCFVLFCFVFTLLELNAFIKPLKHNDVKLKMSSN